MLRIDALTGLRFFAAAFIFLWHVRESFFSKDAFAPFYLAGAVPLFFVLSGFVLTVGGKKSGAWGDFVVARIARIWPAHMAALVLLFMVFWPWSKVHFESLESAGSLVLNVLLLHDWIPLQKVYWGYNSVSWSISAEMFFYMTFPLLFLQVQKAPARTFALVTGMVVAWILIISACFPKIDTGWLGSMNPVSGVWAFVLGIVAGSWYSRNKGEYMTISRFKWTFLEVFAVCAAFGANAILFKINFPYFPLGLSIFISTLGAAPAYAFLIVVLALSSGLLARFLSTKFLVYLGEVSFSFYLTHQIIIRWYLDSIEYFEGFSKNVHLVFIAAASLIVSMVIYHLIEIPARKFIIQAWKTRNLGGHLAGR